MRCQPDVPLAEASREDSGVHADAVVAHIQRHVVAFVEQVQRNPVRIGVPGDVGEQFTCHAVQRRVERMALRVVDRAVEGTPVRSEKLSVSVSTGRPRRAPTGAVRA
jgi:hypothetical protein